MVLALLRDLSAQRALDHHIGHFNPMHDGKRQITLGAGKAVAAFIGSGHGATLEIGGVDHKAQAVRIFSEISLKGSQAKA